MAEKRTAEAKPSSASKAKPMSKNGIAQTMTQKIENLSKKDATLFLDELVKLACGEASKGVPFTLPGLGKLVLQQRAARKGLNPRTREPIDIPAKTVVKFKIAKAAKDAILGTTTAAATPKKSVKKKAKGS